MDNLISGLLGAIIATILTIIYLYFTEKIRRFHDVYLAVVKYLDDIYIRIMILLSYTEDLYAPEYKSQRVYDISGLKESDIHKINREIIELTLSHGIRSQVAVVYNEGLLLQNLSGLLELFLEVQKEIRDASRAAWIVQEREEIYKFLDEKIDPLRRELQDQFRSQCSIWGIAKTLLKIR